MTPSLPSVSPAAAARPELALSLPINSPLPADPSPIAGSVLPIQRAEELLATLPGVISARIVATPAGAVSEIHVLTTDEVSGKQTVRNIESALMAHLGMRVNHKKISVATSSDPGRPGAYPRSSGSIAGGSDTATPPPPSESRAEAPRRRVYFEDVEVRRSRTKGVVCRVTLRKSGQELVGEAEGLETERSRVELAARAAVSAMVQAEGETRALALEGCRSMDAFDRAFVFVGITARSGRESTMLTGTAEIRDSAETAAVLAVLAATNRWVEQER